MKFEKYFFWVVIFLMIALLVAYHFFPLKYKKELNSVAIEMKIDPSLIAAVIKLESNFDELALSHSGAFGLMQLMPETANWLAEQQFIRGSWRDPLNNIKLGAFYLNKLLADFNHDIHYALNAYHMGPTRLKEVLANNRDFKKTNYTKRINLYHLVYRILYDGFFIYPGE
ncbi:MAG: lytic transglycosylase domain-containing protein [Thermotogota bacterium]|nr:lytic transglycosylase domain-containing protein [Thermotogota bacterium]